MTRMSVELTYDDLQAKRLVNEFAVAGITLALVDFLDTFPQEVRLIWPTKISVYKALFFAVRYGTLVFAVLGYLCGLHQAFPAKACETIFTTTSVFEVVLSLLGEAIVYIRVWAFSGCDRRALYYLIIQYIAMFTVGFIFLAKFLASVKVSSVAHVAGVSCIYHAGDSRCGAIVFSVLLSSVIALVVFMIIIGIYRYKGTPVAGLRSGLFVQFYRDGLVYFLMLGALCIANIALVMTGRRHKFLVQLQICLHSMISTRMVLHLREYSGQIDEVHGQSVYADSSIKNQDLVGTSPLGILKAVMPRFGTARNADEIPGRMSGLKFASVHVSSAGSDSVL